jgi:hypothetical protein
VIFHEFSGTSCVSKIEVSLEADVQAVTGENLVKLVQSFAEKRMLSLGPIKSKIGCGTQQ